jgi:hypothetical protein
LGGGARFVFDDLYPHEVWNNTGEERVVLLIDVERPMTFGAKSLNRAILWGFKRTSYVVEARRSVAAWEARLRARLSAEARSASTLAGPHRQKVAVADDDPELPRLDQPSPAHDPGVDFPRLLGQRLPRGGRPAREQSFDQPRAATTEAPITAAAEDDRAACSRQAG